MENVLKYYEFSEFKKDNSEAFSNNEIAYTELNETHYLIFEKDGNKAFVKVLKWREINNDKDTIIYGMVKEFIKEE